MTLGHARRQKDAVSTDGEMMRKAPIECSDGLEKQTEVLFGKRVDDIRHEPAQNTLDPPAQAQHHEVRKKGRAENTRAEPRENDLQVREHQRENRHETDDPTPKPESEPNGHFNRRRK